jgi:hypothetical protein
MLHDQQIQIYIQQFRDIEVLNNNSYTLEDGLYIGRGGLGYIATKFIKVIIFFDTEKLEV